MRVIGQADGTAKTISGGVTADIKNKKIITYRSTLFAIAATTVTEIPLDLELGTHDVSLFNISSGRVYLQNSKIKSVLVTGRFQFSGFVTPIIYICKNGSPVASVTRNSVDTIDLCAMVDATLNDYISLKVYSNVATNVTAGGIQWNSMQVSVLETND